MKNFRLIFTLLIGLLLANIAPITAADQSQGDATVKYPRVIRYVSSLPAYRGWTCYGLVLSEDNGIPTQVRGLRDVYPQLCYEGTSTYPQLKLMQWAFEAAGLRLQEEDIANELLETLPPDRLADVVLPPVAITATELQDSRRFIFGVALNYAGHRDEVSADSETQALVVFPKPVVPTGPYAPVRAGIQIGKLPPTPVLLLDYEVELGLVLLKDVDLRNPPRSYDAFLDNVAFFTANDVSDREPIILDTDAGYTRGKSRPTYLPIGPWMVHGKYLKPLVGNQGEHSLQLMLRVNEARSGERAAASAIRQRSTTDAMLRNPWKIIMGISASFQSGRITCMRDAEGHPYFLHDAEGIIPAGSIILTGTPGGTAIQRPGLLGRMGLFVRGGFSIDGAKKTFIRKLEQNIANTAYLEPGDQVESSVQYLGRQRWPVVLDSQRKPYGVNATGTCSPADLLRG